ncbi:MAG TPA: glycosyltransferase family 1 protein [Pyrinomonadaceae bacterium]|jgi:UDP-galactopyranose mutase
MNNDRNNSRKLELNNKRAAHQKIDHNGEAGKLLSFHKTATIERAKVLNLESDGQDLSNTNADLVCLSHLRWNFVYQRPQHLLGRCAKERRVFFVEEPILGEGPLRLDVTQSEEGVYVVVPHLPEGLLSDVAVEAVQQALIDRLFAEHNIREHILWYYTPMALGFTRHLKPLAVVYDCMDELSAFKNAPRALRDREAELFRRADLVFTGGQTLYEAKRHQHANVHAFPSSIDCAHFAKARDWKDEPADQANIPHPRLGFFGVIDERFDLELLDGVAAARPDWQFVIIGPVVKINPEDLPRHANIHYLGGKSYKELPAYLAGWDVAALLFARNESTRFISPTKTPEYLAAGKPVVSTSIRDVVRPYGELGLVRIADSVADFIVAAAEIGMDERVEDAAWLRRVDEFLAKNSWDITWARMSELIEGVVTRRVAATTAAAASRANRQTYMPTGTTPNVRVATASNTFAAGD